ncbi:MAG: hypothetical protein MRZ79_15260 [Bacteroidia bacterium]|nr:hypothetical protein [Bacteroidia bacterium]
MSAFTAQIFANTKTSLDKALDAVDSLAVPSPKFMHGRWKPMGREFHYLYIKQSII